MGFASGLYAGSQLIAGINADQRAREQEARTSKKFGWEEEDRQRTMKIQGAEDVLRDKQIALLDPQQAVAPAVGPAAAPLEGGLRVPQAALPPLDADQEAAGVRVGTAQGMPTAPVGAPQPAVPATAATAAGAITGTATAPTPINQATPTAPAGVPAAPATAPAPAAPPGPKMGNENVLSRGEQIAQLQQQQAIWKGDHKAYAEAKLAERAAGVQNITDTSVKEFMALSPEEREHRAYSPNLTGEVPLMTLSTDKNGMTVVVIDPKTGRPLDNGKPIQLSWADAAQLHAADALAKKGFGAEALDTATKVNARIGESIKSINALTKDAAGVNNTAAHQGGMLAETERHDRAIEGIQAEHLKLAKDKAAVENNQITAIGPDGFTYFNKTDGKVGNTPWAKGTTEEQKNSVISTFKTRVDPKLSADGQYMTVGTTVYQTNPNFNADPKKVGADVNVTDRWIDVTPGAAGKTGDVASAIKAYNDKNPNGPPSATPKQGVATPPVQPPPRQLTQNEKALAEAKARHDEFERTERARRGREATARTHGLQVPSSQYAD